MGGLHKMKEKAEEFEELAKLFPDGKLIIEGGNSFYYLPRLILPEPLQPSPVQALFYPDAKSEGYPSLLYLNSKVTGGPQRNWNKTRVICGKTWYAFSWQFTKPMRLAELLRCHISSIFNN